MKTTKQGSNTRRSQRNITNGSRVIKVKKALSVKGKRVVGGKSRIFKSAPTKQNLQSSKRKRVPEVAPEDPPPETTNSSSEQQNDEKPAKSIKTKPKRLKKPKETVQTEDHGWRMLDEFAEKELVSDDSKKKAVSSQKSDRRKQSLVERDIPCAVMVQTIPVAVSIPKDGNDSDCEVLDGAVGSDEISGSQGNAAPIEVDIDDIHSEAGSNFCEIIDEPGVMFDYRRLYAQASHVNLPSTLWAFHLDPRREFVSFTRFNPDFPSNSSRVVDRTVLFKGSLQPKVFCNEETMTLPEEIHSVETLTDVSQVLQHLNAMMLP